MDYIKKPKRKKERTILDKETWRLSPFTRRSVQYIEKAIIITRIDFDPEIRLLVKEENKIHFTNELFNRLVSYLRNHYDMILLVTLQTPESYDKEIRQLYISKEKREKKRAEKDKLKIKKSTIIKECNKKDNSLPVV